VFTAFRLGASTTSAILLYRVYGYGNANATNTNNVPMRNSTLNTTEIAATPEWKEVERRRIRVQLDGSLHNTVLDEADGLKLSVMGMGGKLPSFNQQLEEGMYFVENLPDGQLDEIRSQPLNRVNEHE